MIHAHLKWPYNLHLHLYTDITTGKLNTTITNLIFCSVNSKYWESGRFDPFLIIKIIAILIKGNQWVIFDLLKQPASMELVVSMQRRILDSDNKCLKLSLLYNDLSIVEQYLVPVYLLGEYLRYTVYAYERIIQLYTCS